MLATRGPDCSQFEMGCWQKVALRLPVSQPRIDLCMPCYLNPPCHLKAGHQDSSQSPRRGALTFGKGLLCPTLEKQPRTEPGLAEAEPLLSRNSLRDMAVCPPHCLLDSVLARWGAVGPTSPPLRLHLCVLSVQLCGFLSAVSTSGHASAVVFIPSSPFCFFGFFLLHLNRFITE